MICQFSFQNFMSYKDNTVFDFQAAAIPEFSESLIEKDSASPLLPVSVIYGPNGGGKTNLIKALACLISTVVKPIRDLGKTRERLIIQHKTPCIPFLLDEESKENGTEFLIFFRTGGNEYRYSLSLKKEQVLSESLHWKAIGGKKPGLVFDRIDGDISLGSRINKSSVNTNVNPKMPYLSFLAINYNFPIIAEVIKWFESCIIRNYANMDIESSFIVFSDDSWKNRFIRAMNDLDIDIVDYRINEDENRVYTTRLVDGRSYDLPYDYESAGTKKLISVLPFILLALHEGRPTVIDELDAKLHPKLLRYIINLFRNPEINRHGAQLLFTSQDLTTMRNDVFRRDEIWFAYESEAHDSRIYSLYDIRDENDRHINNTAAYDKQYLEGRYGADPYLQNILGDEWNEP